MGVTKELFGSFDCNGKSVSVDKYTLTSDSGVEVHLLSYGAGICGVVAPDRSGVKQNVVLGFDSIDGYRSHQYQGSSIGRCGNRITEGKFSLGGQPFQLTLNNKGNHLHGGTDGWNKRVWNGVIAANGGVVFSLVSEDGDQGYPGTVMAQVQYRLSSPGRLEINFTALTSAPCPINMTNHAFFNLAGHSGGREELMQHTAELNCSEYLPVNEKLLPTGEQRPVEGTSFDLRSATQFGKAFTGAAAEGFDHCFVLADRGGRGKLRLGATFAHPPSGRALEVWTTAPGLQFYTATAIPSKEGEMVGRGGVSYLRHGAFCCEPEELIDAVNQPSFPSCIVQPGEMYKHTMVYNFTLV